MPAILIIWELIKKAYSSFFGGRGKYWDRARKKRLKFDRYTCKSCGIKNVVLDVHHRNGWSWFPAERFENSNLISLCKPCHQSFHKWNGGTRKKCTKALFVKWMKLPIKRRVIFK